MRLSANPAYSANSVSPLDAIELLTELREIGKHHFWEAMPSVLDLAPLPLAGHRQLTDALLVVVAEQHQGRVVTFDAGLKAYAGSAQRVLVLAP